MPNPILKHFKYEHLPENLKSVSQPICELANRLDNSLPDSP